jgi:aryl-alcohol dehydrogenase-like predicted oxidoreductase
LREKCPYPSQKESPPVQVLRAARDTRPFKEYPSMAAASSSVRHERLGKSDLSVCPIGLGCMSMSGTYGPSDDAESIRVIHHALDVGMNFLDSSDMYGWGHNETLLGKALKGQRQRTVLATKFGQTQSGMNSRPEYVQQACETSLKRLEVDTIDLYYQHRVDPKVPIEETVGAMSRLIEQGKVRYLGLSEAAPATIRRAHKTHPITALQSEYSLMYREVADASLPVCRELGIAFVAYSPLGRGLLTGTLHSLSDIPENDRRRAHPRFEGENLNHNLKLMKRIEEIAHEKRVSPGQLVLAWVLAQGKDLFPIPGTKRTARVDENLGAVMLQLTAQDLAWIDEAMPPGSVKGQRYPDAVLKGVQI